MMFDGRGERLFSCDTDVCKSMDGLITIILRKSWGRGGEDAVGLIKGGGRADGFNLLELRGV